MIKIKAIIKKGLLKFCNKTKSIFIIILILVNILVNI